MRSARAKPNHLSRLAAALAASIVIVGCPPSAGAATVFLDAYDATGDPIPYSDFIATLEAEGWRNDVTYTLADGTIVAFQPLHESGGRAAFDVNGAPVGLSLAWPTASTGYSTLFLDNGGAGFASGTVNFTYRAALDYRAKLTDALARRPAFVPTSEFTAVEREADALHRRGRCGPYRERARRARPASARCARARVRETALRLRCPARPLDGARVLVGRHRRPHQQLRGRRRIDRGPRGRRCRSSLRTHRVRRRRAGDRATTRSSVPRSTPASSSSARSSTARR